MITQAQRILFLRILALRNARIGYEPHRERIKRLYDAGIRKVMLWDTPADINRLAWKYRRQISAELVPFVASADALRLVGEPGGGRRGP